MKFLFGLVVGATLTAFGLSILAYEKLGEARYSRVIEDLCS